MECQVDKNEHLRHLLLFAFNQDFKAAKAARQICAMYGEDAIAERTAQKWFSRFKEGHFDVTDNPRSGRPVEFDEDRLNELIHQNPRQSTRKLANKMGCGQQTIVRHLSLMGKVQKLGACVPHVLTESNKL